MAALAAVLCLAAVVAAAGERRVHDGSVLLQVDLAVDRTALSLAGQPETAPSGASAAPGAAEATSGAANATRSAANATKGAANATHGAANATGGAANASSGANAANASSGAAEKEAGWCGFKSQPGFITAHTLPPTDNVLLDFTEAFKNNDNKVRFVVTAMSVSGTYKDGEGYLMEFASPMEETQDTMFEFRLAADNISVDVFQPQLELRTSDPQSLAALRRGAGNGHFDTLGTFKCAMRGPASFASQVGTQPNGVVQLVSLNGMEKASEGLATQDNGTSAGQLGSSGSAADQLGSNASAASEAKSNGSVGDAAPLPSMPAEAPRVIISGGNLIRKGFFVAKTAKQAASYKLLHVKSYKGNLDVAVEYMMPDGAPLAVGYSLVQLPKDPMKSRPADDRLLYFTTDYKDLGEHNRFYDELPEESVDRKVSTIWRYNLATLPGNQIRIHIDPTVPKRWRKFFREGVEAWNDAFKLIGRPKAVRAVLPEDDDWPADYDVSDARFSTISWTISSQVVSMGIAKVDPRSGEILKSDIIMSDGWVRSWLGDLDLLAPNFTHQLDQTKGYRFEACSDGNVILGRRRIPGRLRMRGDWGKKISLLSAAVGKPMQSTQRDEVLGQGLRHVVTHETGHILGLRHNFKGSLGVSYACIRSAACTAVRGLTASVMDYVPVNYPSADAPDVHLFSPVLGEYDKLAIRYGYSEVGPPNASADAAAAKRQPATLEAELKSVLLEAENYATCYDADRIMGQDPACAAYDMSADPLQYFEDELRRLAEVQRNLLNTSVMPGAPYTHYGDAVDTVLLMAESTGIKVIDWLGGMDNQYVYRRADGRHTPKSARRAVPAEVQKRALSLALHIARPEKAGLMPPQEAVPYLVAASGGSGSVESLDLALRERAIGRQLLLKMLAPGVLLKLHAEEQYQMYDGKSGGLPIGEFLDLVTKEVMKDGFKTNSLSEWDLQRVLVQGLTDAFDSKLPTAAIAHVTKHLQRLHKETAAALREAPEPSEMEEEQEEKGKLADSEVLRAHLMSLHQDIHKALCNGRDASQCSLGGALPSAAARPVALPALAAALVLGAAALACGTS